MACRRWLEAEISSGRPLALALITLPAFVRIASDYRVFTLPLTPTAACSLVEEWLRQPNVRLLQPSTRTWLLLSKLCKAGQAQGVMVMDAHLGALAVEHGATITTTDRDFMRFPALNVINPILDEPAA